MLEFVNPLGNAVAIEGLQFAPTCQNSNCSQHEVDMCQAVVQACTELHDIQNNWDTQVHMHLSVFRISCMYDVKHCPNDCGNFLDVFPSVVLRVVFGSK